MVYTTYSLKLRKLTKNIKKIQKIKFEILLEEQFYKNNFCIRAHFLKLKKNFHFLKMSIINFYAFLTNAAPAQDCFCTICHIEDTSFDLLQVFHSYLASFLRSKVLWNNEAFVKLIGKLVLLIGKHQDRSIDETVNEMRLADIRDDRSFSLSAPFQPINFPRKLFVSNRPKKSQSDMPRGHLLDIVAYPEYFSNPIINQISYSD